MILSLFSTLRFPLARYLLYAIEKLSESIIGSKRINHFLNLSNQIRTKTIQDYSTIDHYHIPSCIIMNKASFAWNSNQSPQLIDIDLNINNGSLIGIIGPISSCKSFF